MCQLKWNSGLCLESNLLTRKTAVDKFVNQVNIDQSYNAETYLLWMENSCQIDVADSVITIMLVNKLVCV